MLAHLNNLLKLDDQTLGKLVRMGFSVGIALVSMYILSGPIVESVAADVFKKMLLAQEGFQQLQMQSTDNSKDIDELKRDSNAIRAEVSKVQRQVEGVSKDIEAQSKTIGKVETLLNDLVRLQLQRSGSTQ